MVDATSRGAGAQVEKPQRTLRGDEARKSIQDQIKAHNDGLLAVLGKYQAPDTIRIWHGTIRAIEEFINVPLFGIDDENIVRWLFSVRLDRSFIQNPGVMWMSVKAALSPHLDAGTVDRFCRLTLQIVAIRSAFVMHGQATFGPGITLDTVGDAMAYLQSRRRHFVALLYLMPRACRGSKKLAPLDIEASGREETAGARLSTL